MKAIILLGNVEVTFQSLASDSALGSMLRWGGVPKLLFGYRVLGDFETAKRIQARLERTADAWPQRIGGLEARFPG